MGKIELKLEVNAGLLEEARKHGVPLAEAVEYGIRVALARSHPSDPIGIEAALRHQRLNGEDMESRAKQWAEENADAIKDHRRRIDEFGVFGEDLRTW